VDGKGRVRRRFFCHPLSFLESLDDILVGVPDCINEERRWVRALRD